MTPASDGIDISHHQGKIDWGKVPDFRLCATKLTDGIHYPADKLAVHVGYMEAMRAHKFPWIGTYHWLRGNSNAKAQADYYLSTLVNRLGGLHHGEFVQLDWETTAGIPNPTVAQVEEWCDRVEQVLGRQCVIVYSSDWVPGWRAWRDANPTRPYWHANYNLSSSSQGGQAESVRYDAAVWQWTSKASVPGINGGVDMNAVLNPAVLDRLTGRDAPPVGGPDVTTAECETIIRKVLNEGTAQGLLDWAGTNIEGINLGRDAHNQLVQLAADVQALTDLVWAVAADVAAIKNKP